MHPQAAYDELMRRCREQALLSSAAALLEWDEVTYLPKGGIVWRGEVLAYLSGLQHQQATDPRVGELLAELEGSELVRDPLAAEAVNVREIRREYDRQVRLPRQLVEELARVTSLAQQHWNVARQDADFGRFRPWLEQIFALKRSQADCLGGGYDALLAEYEPGCHSRDLWPIFAALRRELAPLLSAIAGSRRKSSPALLHRDYPIERQRIFGEEVAAAIGFDFEQGRLDETVHPFFSTIGPGDCRITTRYSLNRFGEAFFGLLHEVGHALYEQGLAPAHHGTPMGEAVSLGVHESQARLWENLVGRSRPFWQFFFPHARRVFHETLQNVRLDAFYRAVNHVAPSLNRVQADEVTYNLHILLRFELEQALIGGDLAVADLPAAWSEKCRHYLGLAPADDAEGCLQDGHWAAGLVGYFPTYTLGNLFAAQLFERANQELGGLDRSFARGEFAPFLSWLREKVHRHGCRYPARQLVELATASPLDHRPLVRYLRQKFEELYR
jgi:carboxypeptidase Taq